MHGAQGVILGGARESGALGAPGSDEGKEARLPPGRRLSSQQTPRAHPNTEVPASAAPI